MKFFYIAALLVPTILAADQAVQDSQDMQDAQISKTDALQQLIKKECTDLPPNCVETLEKLLNGAKKSLGAKGYRAELGKNKECVGKLTACAKKVGPKFAAAHGPAHPQR